MVDYWEIVQGDYGKVYDGIVRDENLSDCTAKITVWGSDNTIIIDAQSCIVQFNDPDTHVYYTVKQTDFENVAKGTYNVMIEFTKTGIVEHTMSFKWKVYSKPPASA